MGGSRRSWRRSGGREDQQAETPHRAAQGRGFHAGPLPRLLLSQRVGVRFIIQHPGRLALQAGLPPPPPRHVQGPAPALQSCFLSSLCSLSSSWKPLLSRPQGVWMLGPGEGVLGSIAGHLRLPGHPETPGRLWMTQQNPQARGSLRHVLQEGYDVGSALSEGLSPCLLLVLLPLCPSHSPEQPTPFPPLPTAHPGPLRPLPLGPPCGGLPAPQAP